MKRIAPLLIGVWLFLQNPPRRTQRGLSQSAENAILLVGAVTIAGIVISLLTVYVRSHMPGQ